MNAGAERNDRKSEEKEREREKRKEEENIGLLRGRGVTVKNNILFLW